MIRPLRQSEAAKRNLISARTIEGVAAKRAAGVRLGRPRRCPDSTSGVAAVADLLTGRAARG
jgi:DNA invertase Pin-like site-specific DNA recombinase